MKFHLIFVSDNFIICYLILLPRASINTISILFDAWPYSGQCALVNYLFLLTSALRKVFLTQKQTGCYDVGALHLFSKS